MDRFDIIFQFTVGNVALTSLNLVVFNDPLWQAAAISTGAWLAFWGGRVGGRYFIKLHRKTTK